MLTLGERATRCYRHRNCRSSEGAFEPNGTFGTTAALGKIDKCRGPAREHARAPGRLPRERRQGIQNTRASLGRSRQHTLAHSGRRGRVCVMMHGGDARARAESKNLNWEESLTRWMVFLVVVLVIIWLRPVVNIVYNCFSKTTHSDTAVAVTRQHTSCFHHRHTHSTQRTAAAGRGRGLI